MPDPKKPWHLPLQGDLPWVFGADFGSGKGALVTMACLRCEEQDEKWLSGPVTGAEVRVAMLRLARVHDCGGSPPPKEA